jgi:DNA-binding beta-propeller fold protein YncE
MRLVATLALACALLLVAGAASGAEGDPFLKSCYSSAGTAPCTALTPPFSGLDVEVGSDGRHLYAAVADAGGGFNGLRLFDVGTGGTLTARSGAAHVTNQPPQDLDVSPDGRNLYVAAGSELVVLSRDPASGALAPAQSLTGPSLFDSLGLSPDGTSVYARGPSHLTIFDRNAASGMLTQKACMTEETALPCTSARGIAGTSRETVVSADGRHVYTTNELPGGVAVFNRAADGTLTQPAGGCVTVGGTSGSAGGAECAVGPGTLAQAVAATVDAQGGYVFVSAGGGQTVFRRDGASGALTQTDCLDEVGGAAPPAGCREATAAAGSDAAITPDGNHAVLNAQAIGIAFFAFDRTAGTLAQRTCFSASATPTCIHAAGLGGGAGAVAVSSNGATVFAAFRGGSIASFERDVAPQCRNRVLTVRRRAPVWVPLACTDANGDEVKLAIAAPPLGGTLNGLDQARDRVRYTPEATYRGKDSFRYRGAARGTAGRTATVTLNIVAKPAKADRKPPNTLITAGPPKTSRSRAVRFAFRSTERGSEFQCKPDWRKRWASCSSPTSYGRLRSGAHSFQVRAIDPAGNADRSPAKRAWRISR